MFPTCSHKVNPEPAVRFEVTVKLLLFPSGTLFLNRKITFSWWFNEDLPESFTLFWHYFVYCWWQQLQLSQMFFHWQFMLNLFNFYLPLWYFRLVDGTDLQAVFIFYCRHVFFFPPACWIRSGLTLKWKSSCGLWLTVLLFRSWSRWNLKTSPWFLKGFELKPQTGLKQRKDQKQSEPYSQFTPLFYSYFLICTFICSPVASADFVLF